MSGSGDVQSLSMVWDLPHSAAKVWRALTESELLAEWLMANDMEAAVGHRFTFRQEPTPWWDGVVHSEVLELEPGRRLRYTWRSGGSSAAALDTVVTWTLTPTSGGTRLTLEHSGFPRENTYAFDGAKEGWERMVGEVLPGVLARIA